MTKEPSFQLFDREAARYDAWFDSDRGQALFASELICLRQLTADLPRPWLEVGVGTGRFAEALGVDVGVDPAVGAIQHAARRGVKALPALGQALPFEDGEFGTAFVIVTLCFAEDPLGLLFETRRVVAKPGGVVLGIVPAESPWGHFYSEKAASGHVFYSRARFYTLAQLGSLIRSASLRIERAASTLFQAPDCECFEVESARDGLHEAAGFAALLCRR
jgi:ubiquinone/menaquinone biosynthesis C-methylase UbiE